jgi:hypothetical protein
MSAGTKELVSCRLHNNTVGQYVIYISANLALDHTQWFKLLACGQASSPASLVLFISGVLLLVRRLHAQEVCVHILDLRLCLLCTRDECSCAQNVC